MSNLKKTIKEPEYMDFFHATASALELGGGNYRWKFGSVSRVLLGRDIHIQMQL